MSVLRDLDARVVPRAAARLRSAVERGRARRATVRGRARAVVAPLPAGGRPGPLRRLDDRFASRGPLAVVRDVPQIGLLVIAALLLAAAGVALARHDGGGTGSTGTSVSQEQRVLGPENGASVSDYVDSATAASAEQSRERPQALREALVSLSDYRTPTDARGLLEGLEVQRAYLRVPSSAPTELLSADVTDLVGDLRQLYGTTAGRKAEDQRDYLGLARAIVGQDEQQQRAKVFYEAAAELAGKEATAYRTGCACLFALVVRGTAATLAALPALAGVRVVELAPRGVPLERLRIRPLGPEQTTTAAPHGGARPTTGG